MSPRRIRLRRIKGWRMPPNTVSVARPGRWGNPFSVASCIDAGFAEDRAQAQQVCVDAFRDWLRGNTWAAGSGQQWDDRRRDYLASIPDLRGKNLACWCGLCERHQDGRPFDEPCADCPPCHADVLGEML